MTDSPPHLRVVSERSSNEIEHERRLAELRGRLIALTANLLRVTRGAGRPWEVVSQCVDTAKAYQAYLANVGHLPTSYEVGEILRLKREWGSFSPDEEIDHGRSLLVAGALQYTASTLLGQLTQVAAGQREMGDGERLIVDARERQRAERRAAERTEKKAKKPQASRTKMKGSKPQPLRAKDGPGA